jgi:hypothetical protein
MSPPETLCTYLSTEIALDDAKPFLGGLSAQIPIR